MKKQRGLRWKAQFPFALRKEVEENTYRFSVVMAAQEEQRAPGSAGCSGMTFWGLAEDGSPGVVLLHEGGGLE